MKNVVNGNKNKKVFSDMNESLLWKPAQSDNPSLERTSISFISFEINIWQLIYSRRSSSYTFILHPTISQYGVPVNSWSQG